MKLKLWQKTAMWIFGLPLAVVLLLAALPTHDEPVIPDANLTVGAQGQGALSGLQVPFPQPVVNSANPSTPEKVELGRLLFFDAALSSNNQLACASCHNPALGFADGKPLAQGGATLARNTPALYGVAYSQTLFWDGRAPTLEEQSLTPLTNHAEMAVQPAQLETELAAMPRYAELFAAAFPNQSKSIKFEQVTFALAAFERTLLANNTPFDRYAGGDSTALSPSQKRGLALFRSGATGCYNCHPGPLFTNGGFERLGVNSADNGRADVTGNAADRGAFKVPTLRNIALSAPYMHDGSLPTLEAVVDMYATGKGLRAGADARPAGALSRFIRPFELSPAERADLVNFLYALTDESSTPDVPENVPSGLPLAATPANSGRVAAAAANTGSSQPTARASTTLRVKSGASIQTVVDGAIPGDIVEIEAGIYNEAVVTDTPNLTLRGVADAAGKQPVLDGQGRHANGISATGNNVVIENLTLRNYRNNGVFVDGATGIVLRDLFVEDTGVYGVYPVHCSDVLIERVTATGVNDAGIYVGQCRNIVVRDSIGFGNVIGIEVENSIGAEVYNNETYDNSVGIFIDLLPNLPSKASRGTRLHDNISRDNNLQNFSTPEMTSAMLPNGVGILVLGADDVEIYDNNLKNNNTVGLAVFSAAPFFDNLDIDPNPERLHAHGNTYSANGSAPDKLVVELGLYGADVLWDASNWSPRFDDEIKGAFPPALPATGWPVVFRRAYWQLLNFVINTLG
ncbi:MAG: right-handed parallel beta-helix repeat-containing protein [Chloroflexi bacterium]|nr:right-handed parallel beta-helix repeat-containing protein [Chloroflexota bacterium]